MDFEVAIYNGGCVDGRKIVNSVKAAYLYADKVRIYDYSVPLGYQIDNLKKENKRFVKPYYGHASSISGFFNDDRAYIKAGFPNRDAYVLDYLRVYIYSALFSQELREHYKNYDRKNYHNMLANLGVELIEPEIVFPDTGDQIMQKLEDFINRFEADKGVRMFNRPEDINDRLSLKEQFPSYLSEYAISKLPCFENASVDEIVDIRMELDAYIVPYREAIIKISNSIAEIPNSESLQQECATLYLDEIEPKVAAIKEAVRDNNVFKNIFRSALKSELGWTGIGAIAAAIATRENVASSLGIASTVALGGYSITNGISTTIDNEEKIQKNEMYFLYEAGEILEN